MADTFQGKKVLLMVFPFFDYGNAIATALEDLGADVHLIYNRFEVESFRSSMH